MLSMCSLTAAIFTPPSRGTLPAVPSATCESYHGLSPNSRGNGACQPQMPLRCRAQLAHQGSHRGGKDHARGVPKTLPLLLPCIEPPRSHRS